MSWYVAWTFFLVACLGLIWTSQRERGWVRWAFLVVGTFGMPALAVAALMKFGVLR